MIKNLGKNFIWNAVGSTVNACNSLFFMIIVTRINGINDAGIFTFAFSLACMFYIIGIYSGRTYQVTENDSSITDVDYFYSRLITCMCMILFSIIYCFIKDYSIFKISIIMCLVLFKSLEAFSEVLYAILQKNNQLYKSGISLFIKAVLGVFVFTLIDYITKNIISSIISIIFVNFVIILFYDYRNCNKLNFRLTKFNKKGIVKIIKRGFFTFAFAFLTQYVINAPKYAIDRFLNYESQTIYGILVMPATIIILLGQFIVQPFLLILKNYLNENKKKFYKMTFNLSFIILIFGIIASAIAYFIGIPFLNIVYNINLNSYVFNLVIIILGATLYGITVVISSSLTTMRSTFSQMIIFIITSVVANIVSNIFVSKYQILGSCYSYLISMFVLLIMYVITYIYIFKKKGVKKNEKSNCNSTNL